MWRSLIIKVCSWLWEGKFYLLSGISILVCILYVTNIINFKPDITSGLMTIIGVFIVYYMLLRDTKEFSFYKPKTLQNWLSSFPSSTLITITHSIADSGTGSDMFFVEKRISDNATDEEKIRFLMQIIEELQNKIIKMHIELQGEIINVNQKTRELEAKTDGIAKSLKELIANHAVGSIDVNIFGICLTLSGAVIQIFR